MTIASASPYFSNTVEWTSWFRTIAGVRADFFSFDVDSNTPENSGKEHDAIVSPKLSLIFGPWRNTEYFLNWGQGFHSNDARGTTITVDPKTGDPAQRVDPLVRTTGYEAGLRSLVLPGLTTSLAIWQLRQDSELLFVGDAGTTEASRPSKRTGVEWVLQYVPRPWLAFDLTAAFTRARFDDDDPAGNRIPGAPDAVASAGMTLDNLNGWFGSLRWRYFGSRALIEDNSVRSESTSLLNGPRRLHVHQEHPRLARRVQHLQLEVPRHRLFLCLAPARGGARGGRRQALPPGREQGGSREREHDLLEGPAAPEPARYIRHSSPA